MGVVAIRDLPANKGVKPVHMLIATRGISTRATLGDYGLKVGPQEEVHEAGRVLWLVLCRWLLVSI